jgi:hypothetical protein
MTNLLEQAISQVKQLPDAEQDEIARMILEKIQAKDKLTLLWDKIDQLGEDSEQPSMEEITAMVKEAKQNKS